MQTFRVWAPLPRKVEVLVDGQRHPMTRQPDDWWTANVASAKPDSEYGFLVDGEGPFPDPRSASQPKGVHGLSRLTDDSAFAWTDRQFQAPPLSSAVIYELHLGTFTPEGTFLAVIAQLDHLVSLGHDACGTDAGGGIFRQPRLGLRWRGLIRSASCLRHAG